MKGFVYEQLSGNFAVRNGDFECPLLVGSAGRAHGRNNPEAEREVGIGPIPRGLYHMRIVEHPRFASPAIRLDAADEATTSRLADYKRAGFYIHGGTHSEGCILIQKAYRDVVAGLIRVGFDKLAVFDGIPF